MKFLKVLAAFLLLSPVARADLCVDASTGLYITCAPPSTTAGNSSGVFTSLSASGVITSTLATGTAPFTIASTTNVANLNASTLSGATFANPGAIGGGVQAAGSFTTLSASSTVNGTGFSTYLASPPAIGGTASAAGTFTALTVGVASSITGIVNFKGLTSGIVSVLPQAVAGTYNFNLPASAGSSGQPLLSAAGGSAPMTFGTLGIAAGGTGAITAQAATQGLSTRYVVCASGATVSAGADTSEDTLYDCTIPANSLGANGSIIFGGRYTYTNSGNNKVLRIRYSTISGTIVYQQTATTSTNQPILPITIQNKNSATTNESGVNSLTSYTASAGTVTTPNVDTTAATHVVYTCAKASSGETCSISSVLVEIVYAP